MKSGRPMKALYDAVRRLLTRPPGNPCSRPCTMAAPCRTDMGLSLKGFYKKRSAGQSCPVLLLLIQCNCSKTSAAAAFTLRTSRNTRCRRKLTSSAKIVVFSWKSGSTAMPQARIKVGRIWLWVVRINCHKHPFPVGSAFENTLLIGKHH